MRKLATMTTLLAATATALGRSPEPPQWPIANAALKINMYLPEKNTGYYRGTRFDWSGVIADLEYKGHHYYGPWYTKTAPDVSDFIYQGADIVAGPCSAITGPVEEFAALGYDEARVGGAFVKIGVGVLRKPEEKEYSAYHLYEITDGGKWTVARSHDSVGFTQELHDPATGYGYLYSKQILLVGDKPEMQITHTLRNTGTKKIVTRVYDHNFLVLDHQPTGPDFTVTFPFKVTSGPPLDKGLAEFRGKQMVYLKTLTGEQRVYTPIEGFGQSAADYHIKIDNARLKAGMTITADQPPSEIAFWSIRSVLAVEPFIAISLEPGKSMSWTYTYTYHAE
jgi:hypothetical protein